MIKIHPEVGKQLRCAQSLGHVRLFATPWPVARQAPLSMGLFRQKYHSGLPFPPPGDLPDPGIEPVSPESLASAGGFFTVELLDLTGGGAQAVMLAVGRSCKYR